MSQEGAKSRGADPEPPTDEKQLNAGNYCVSFIDLLGQRAALQGQGLLPVTESEEQRQALTQTLMKSVGSISALQRRAQAMIDKSGPDPNSELRAQLSAEEQLEWDEMSKTKITTQRWSDGLVQFACLGDREIKCHMNNVFGLFTITGALCFMGLASKRPIRGAIEIAWGLELHPGELYGAAIARAYELESEVASYPRIVIGPEMLRFLDVYCSNTSTEVFARADRALAQLCRSMLHVDTDGHVFLHYLGEAFRSAVTTRNHPALYAKAHEFALEQLKEHRENKNSKLAFRYSDLLHYFEANRPSS